MSSRTLFLARLIGLYCVLAALSMMIHRQMTEETVRALLHSPPAMLILGVVALPAGLALVLGHNIWSGGPLAVIVTVVGWIVLIKGALFLFLPSEFEAKLFLGQLRYERLFYLYASISLILGIYLSYGGFGSASRS